MRLPELVQGVFIKRISRFSAEVVVDGVLNKVYVPNTGRMKELLREKAKVYLARNAKEGRLTQYDLVLVDYKGTLVSIDSRVPNLLLAEVFSKGTVPFWENSVIGFRKETTFGNSRFDFKVDLGPINKECHEIYVEAKSVTLVTEGIAKFPDAPTERGSKHLKELAEAVRQGYRGMVVFVIQRADAVEFTPNGETDPDFAENLWLAKDNGVEVRAFRCVVRRNSITLDCEVPVVGR